MSADIVVVLLPGGKSTHVELGITIAQGKKTILHLPDELMNHFRTTSTFYHLAEVEKCYGTPDDLVAMIVGQDMAHVGSD